VKWRFVYELASIVLRRKRSFGYLWPRAGGITFSFSLKARVTMKAQSTESILYDYYNPEARASVPPTRFVVK
jgi:hypothetical protein